MIWMLVGFLILVWLILNLAAYTLSGAIHILLLVALVLFIYNLFFKRETL